MMTYIKCIRVMCTILDQRIRIHYGPKNNLYRDGVLDNLDWISSEKRQVSWLLYWCQRFELPELKLLVDAILIFQGCGKNPKLIQKLKSSTVKSSEHTFKCLCIIETAVQDGK